MGVVRGPGAGSSGELGHGELSTLPGTSFEMTSVGVNGEPTSQDSHRLDEPFAMLCALSGKAQEATMSKRELIDTGTDKRYVRRDDKGRFKESDDVGRSLSQDVRKSAKTKVKPGHGDRGDQKL